MSLSITSSPSLLWRGKPKSEEPIVSHPILTQLQRRLPHISFNTVVLWKINVAIRVFTGNLPRRYVPNTVHDNDLEAANVFLNQLYGRVRDNVPDHLTFIVESEVPDIADSGTIDLNTSTDNNRWISADINVSCSMLTLSYIIRSDAFRITTAIELLG